MEKLSMLKETTCLLSKNQDHQSLLHFPILLTTSTTLFLNQPFKKSGSNKFLKEFQKSGMKWPFWNKKFNRVLQLIWMSNKKESPNWTFQKSLVLKTHSTVEACLWITSKHAETKTLLKLKKSSLKKLRWLEIKRKRSLQASPIWFANN